MTTIHFANEFPTAKKHYTCNGCGEVHIEPGNLYMRSKMMDENGNFIVKRMCIRCTWAIKASLERMGDGVKVVKDGDLKWCRLASPFRKAWTKLASSVSTVEGFEKAKNEFLEAIGVKDPQKGERTMEDVKNSKEQRTTRVLRKDAKALKQERAIAKAFKSQILEKIKGIKVEMLRLKLSHLKGDIKYDELHASIVNMMVSLEEFVNSDSEKEATDIKA